MKITPRQWIETNLFIKVTIDPNKTNIDTYFKLFLIRYCQNLQAIDNTFPLLVLENSEIVVTHGLQCHILYTYPFNNHPFMMFSPLKEPTDYTIVIPLGNRVGQSNINTLYPLIPYLTTIERNALFQLIIKSIVIRQQNLVTHPKYSVLNCYIINECINKVNAIALMNESAVRKEALINETEKFFFDKIRLLLDHYFVILQEGRFDDAMKFLRGEYNRFFKNKGLTEIFINSKDLVGHLEIFIHLYKLYKLVRDYK
jgi:hypothetical protein